MARGERIHVCARAGGNLGNVIGKAGVDLKQVGGSLNGIGRAAAGGPLHDQVGADHAGLRAVEIKRRWFAGDAEIKSMTIKCYVVTPRNHIGRQNILRRTVNSTRSCLLKNGDTAQMHRISSPVCNVCAISKFELGG